MRFVQALGFDGYSDFKTALNVELAQRPLQVDGPLSAVDGIATSLASSVAADASETAKLISNSRLNDAADRILKSDRVWIFGSGIAGICGEILQYRLLRLGISAVALQDPIVMRELSAQLGNGDVAVAISDSGSTPHTVAFLKNAARRKAFTLAISTRLHSPLADEAQILIQTGTTGGADKAGNVLGIVVRNTQVIETLAQCIERLAYGAGG